MEPYKNNTINPNKSPSQQSEGHFGREKSFNSKNSNNSDVSYLRNQNKSPSRQGSKDKSNRRDSAKSNESKKSQHSQWSEKKETKMSPKPKKNLDILIFTWEKAHLILSANNEAKLNELRNRNTEISIYFHDTLEIPEVPGKVVVFEGKDIEKKCEASKQYFQLLKENNIEDKKDKVQNALVLVPNGLVSMVIGTKGKQIINLAHNTRTNIAVNQPVHKMLHRTISISGMPGQIADALKHIYQIMEDRYFEVKHAELESKPLDLNEVKTTVRIFK